MTKKIVLTIVSIVILVVVLLINNVDNKDKVIYVEIINGDVIVEEVITITSESTFLIELNNVFDLEIQGGFLYKIDFLEAYDNKVAFISLYINDEFSSRGINNLILNDKDKVSFIYTVL